MIRIHRVFLAAAAALLLASPAIAQKSGGILRMPHGDSPASMSIHEEATIVAEGPMMAVFNNLVLFDQHVPQNTLGSIEPELAEDWAWSADGRELTLRLRQGVRWHDGRNFTARDVECTWNMLLGKSAEKFRINPRKSWYWNLDRGGAAARAHHPDRNPAFVFPEMQHSEYVAAGWVPRFVDYLSLGFWTAMAFSPTDISAIKPWAKLLMMLEAAGSLALAALVIARAINIL